MSKHRKLKNSFKDFVQEQTENVMKIKKIMIDKIPAVRYGEASDRCFLYIHGKMGFKEEAESFAEIACTKGWQVLSIDLPEHGERKREKTDLTHGALYRS